MRADQAADIARLDRAPSARQGGPALGDGAEPAEARLVPVHGASVDVLAPSRLAAVDGQGVEPLADRRAGGLADLEHGVVPAEVRHPQGLDPIDVDLRVLVVVQ